MNLRGIPPTNIKTENLPAALDHVLDAVDTVVANGTLRAFVIGVYVDGAESVFSLAGPEDDCLLLIKKLIERGNELFGAVGHPATQPVDSPVFHPAKDKPHTEMLRSLGRTLGLSEERMTVLDLASDALREYGQREYNPDEDCPTRDACKLAGFCISTAEARLKLGQSPADLETAINNLYQRREPHY